MSATIQLLENDLESFDAEIVEIQKLKDELEVKEKAAIDRKSYASSLLERARAAHEKQLEEEKKAAATQKRLQALEEKKKSSSKKTDAKTNSETADGQELPKS